MDETYWKVQGQWQDLYRVVDKAGNTVDVLLRAQRNKAAAGCYFERAIACNGAPDTITRDKSGANLAAAHQINTQREQPIVIRQTKYLNNIVEQDHRAIKRKTRPMLEFKKFRYARIIAGGIETMHRITKGQLACYHGTRAFAARQFYSLAF